MTAGLDAERFTRLRRLGEGGFGVVHEAIDRSTGSRVALKTLTRLDGGALYRFKQEFRALADVAHDNLVRLGELRFEGGEWFFTMELIDGVDWLTYVRGHAARLVVSPTGPASASIEEIHFAPTLEASIDEVTGPAGGGGPAARELAGVDLDRVRATLVQIAAGLEALHAAGIFHRDLKPPNVLVTPEGRVVILDFGIAARRDEVGRTDEVVVGTPSYMAPEQAANRKITAAADWYAVGVMLFEAIAGRLPFEGEVLHVLLTKQHRPAPRLRELRPDVPAELDELCAALLSIDPTQRPTAEEVLAKIGAGAEATPAMERALRRSDIDSLRIPFVGRIEALSTMLGAFEVVTRGSPATLLVHGSSGIGKSALLRAFSDHVEAASQAVVFSGRCYERESVPYKAFDSIVDALSRFLLGLPYDEAAALLPRGAGALVRLFPVLGRVPAIADQPRGQGEAPREGHHVRSQAFAALRELFWRVSKRWPLVLVIDDAQWGDGDSASLLAELTLPPEPPALLLVIAYRSEDADRSPLLAGLGSAGLSLKGARATWTVPLSPLSPVEARELADALCAGSTASAAAVAAESAGHPFFLGELARMSADGRDGRPASVLRLDELVQESTGALPPLARALLRAVCVAGAPIPLTVAAEAAGLGDEETQHAAAILRTSRFLRTATRRSEQHVEAYHDRIREGLTSGLPPDVLRATHAALAAALQRRAEPDLEALFLHNRGAGHDETAAEYARRAADKAASALAFDRAAQFYREALALTPDRTTEGHDLSVRLADALANAGRGAESAKHYLSAARRALRKDQLALHRKAAEQLLFAGHIEAGRAAIESVLSHIGMRLAKNPVEALFRFLFLRLWLGLRGIKHEIAKEAEVPADLIAKIDICWSVASGMGTVDTIEGFRFVTHNLLLSLRAGEPVRLARALVLEASFAAAEGGSALVRANRLVQRARELSEMTKDNGSIALVHSAQGMMAYMGGDFRTSREELPRAIAMYREHAVASRFDLNFALVILAYTYVRLGDVHELSRHMPEALQDATERGDLFLATNLRLAEGNQWWLYRDDPAGAREVADEAVRGWSHQRFHLQHWYEMQARCEIDLYERKGAEALERVVRVWPQMQKAMLFRVQMIRTLVTELRARSELAAWKDGDAAALARASKAADFLVRHPLPWCPPVGQMLLAGVAARRNDESGVCAALEKAAFAFDACDMTLHAATARACLGQWRGGQSGTKNADSASSVMRERGVQSPERLVEQWAPGLLRG
jgi:serine/threonine protein kinase/tetratricopeptide (TPR) repeat protein